MKRTTAIAAIFAALWAVALTTAAAHPTKTGSVHAVAVAHGTRLRPGVILHAPPIWHGHHVRRYQWLRCNANARRCQRIHGATHRRYRVGRRDVGHKLMVRMVVGSRIVQSAPTGVVGPPLPVNTSLPAITDVTSGSTQSVTVGDTLNGTLGSWTGAVDYAWAWQHCTSSSACSTVASGGPTSDASTVASYVVQDSDKGDTIQLVVTAYNTPQ